MYRCCHWLALSHSYLNARVEAEADAQAALGQEEYYRAEFDTDARVDLAGDNIGQTE